MTTTNQPRKPGTPTGISAAAASTKPMAAATTAPPPEQQEGLPCPRCDSTNTKFCYYNNYNFSQPRHFCKSCRRYWTHGGTLRDIPVGGATRKNAKRSRTTPSSSSSSTTSISDLHHSMNSAATTALPVPSAPVFLPIAATDVGPCAFFNSPDQDFKVNGGSSNSFTTTATTTTTSSNSFTSLLSNTQGVVNAGGLWAFGGFGLGLGLGPDVGFGPARVGVWPFSGIPAGESGRIASGLGGDEINNVGGGAEAAIGNTWQFESGENGGLANGSGGGGGGGGGGADWFSWPDLAISTPGTGLR